MTILDEIVANKRAEVAEREQARPLVSLLDEVASAPPPRDFRAALVAAERPAPRVIAEIKRRSPSAGPLRPDLDPAILAGIYEQNGAAAISVLVDKRYFGGSLDDLSAARRAVSLPVLCKEFVIGPYQVYEARLAGADAILLIAAMLDTGRLRDLRQLANGLGMFALIEIHNQSELEPALASGARLVGLNNRDLHTFRVSLDITRRLLPLIPSNVITVSESGIRGAGGRLAMANMGVDAILVGEALVGATDIARATREMSGLTGLTEDGSTNA